jgi:hypothetical protein
MGMSERISISELRKKVRDGYDGVPRLFLGSKESASVVLALVEAVEAAHQAAILSYDARRTDQQNDELQRRARQLNNALAKFSFDDPSPTSEAG